MPTEKEGVVEDDQTETQDSEEETNEDQEGADRDDTKYKLDEEDRSILRTLFSGGPKSDARLIKAKVIKWRV